MVRHRLVHLNGVGVRISQLAPSVCVLTIISANERFMNGLSKRKSVHLRMTHVQFVHFF